MGRRSHLLEGSQHTQANAAPRGEVQEPDPVASVRLLGKMGKNGFQSENAAWKPFLTYPDKRLGTRHDGSPRVAGHDPMKLSLETLTKSGHPNRSTRELVRAMGEEAEHVRAYRDIPAHCLGCSAGDASARRKCAIINCPFWAYRTGRNPHSPRRWKKPPVGSQKEARVEHSGTTLAPGHVAG